MTEVITHTIIGFQDGTGRIHLDLNIMEYNELRKALKSMNSVRLAQRKYAIKINSKNEKKKKRDKPFKPIMELNLVGNGLNQITEDDIIEPEPPITPPTVDDEIPTVRMGIVKAPIRTQIPEIPRPNIPLIRVPQGTIPSPLRINSCPNPPGLTQNSNHMRSIEELDSLINEMNRYIEA